MSSTSKKLMGITPVSGAVEAQAIDFDGTNDYLSRSTDLVGNSDSKTFTLSLWVYHNASNEQQSYVSAIQTGGSFYGINLRRKTNKGNYNVNGGNLADNSAVFNVDFNVSSNGVVQPDNTFIHILVSIDLTDTAKRFVYVNDAVPSYINFSTYTNGEIDFTKDKWRIGSQSFDNGERLDGRLSNVFLDYTYRDLSVEANRRLFVDYDDDGGLVPASGQASLSPILYLPMDDPYDPGRNDGTGGDFTLNGTIARSGRGPNQYNAAASEFDGSADYLSRSNPLSPTKTVTASAWVFVTNDGTIINEQDIFRFNTNLSGEVRFDILAFNSSATIIAQVRSSRSYATNKWYSVQVAVDLGNSIVDIYINGVRDVDSVLTLTNDTIDFGGILGVAAEGSTGGQTIGANISDVWMDDTYIDLSANNPFYDTDTGKPKFLGENGELPTGSSPLIYLPLRADAAGNNKGTGGDFTVNSGPYVGARGPSEFWGESAEFNGTDQYLSRTSALSGISDGKLATVVFSYKTDVTIGTDYILNFNESGGKFGIYRDAQSFELRGGDAGGTTLLSHTVPGFFSDTDWHNIVLSFDMADPSKFYLYKDGSLVSSSAVTHTDGSIKFTTTAVDIASTGGSIPWDGKIGFLWFNTEYIDFSQEANRLKFFDAFNYPVDLGEDGSLPTGNQPLIYLNNDFHLGTNLGSGGDFTPVNTPTDGGFVKG